VNILDWVIVVSIAIFVFNGFRRGFLREVAGLLGIIIALLLAIRLLNDLSVIVAHYLGLSPQIAVVVTAILIFIGVLLFFILLAKLLRKLLDLANLGWIDRLLGSLLGLVKGAIILSILVLIISIMPLGATFTQQQNESVFFQPVRQVVPMVFNAIIRILPAASDFYSEMQQSLRDRSGNISQDATAWLNSFHKNRTTSSSTSGGQ